MDRLKKEKYSEDFISNLTLILDILNSDKRVIEYQTFLLL